MTIPFIYFLLLAAFIGGIDYLVKGIAVDAGRWHLLPRVIRGYSWGIIMVLLYLLAVVAMASFNGSPRFLWGLLLFVNEDLFYWLWRLLLTGRKNIKVPLDIPHGIYWLWLVISNVFILFILPGI